MPPLLKIENICKSFGDLPAVNGLSLEVDAGEIFCLLGPSGCGKTTMLRMLAGFETPESGSIMIDGRDMIAVPPAERPVNIMFQNYALFPHLSVADNIAYGLRRSGISGAALSERVDELLHLVRLKRFEGRKPDNLSGGQRQRTALARALARQPKLLLLDEPLAALDRKLREETQIELVALQRQLGTSFIVVTHDQDEAMSLASRIGIMNEGHLIQTGSPQELYDRPENAFVADFLGEVSFLTGAFIPGEPDVTIALRPEHVSLRQASASATENEFDLPVHYESATYLGANWMVRVKNAGSMTIKALLSPAEMEQLAPQAGARLTVLFRRSKMHVLDPEGLASLLGEK